MRAIVLAAGKGERLKEFTKSLPKPMIKVKGKPILEHNLEWLREYGITDIYINLHHLPEIITDYFKDGTGWGVKIKYSYESRLLGTAGAVRKIVNEFWDNTDDFFLVIYGDNLLKYNLQEIINFHKNKKGLATIAVYEKDDVSQSGIVVMNKNGKILKFIEKPKPEEAISNLVNTGIYVLEPGVLNYILPDTTIDFGKEVFPEMLKSGENIYSIIVKGSLTAVDTTELLNKAME